MKKHLALVTFLTSTCFFVHGQSADRFIRIVGNATKQYTAYQWKAEITLHQPKEKSLEEMHATLIDSLREIGISESALQAPTTTKSKSSGSNQAKYTLILQDFSKVQRVTDFRIGGYRIEPGDYSFSPVSQEDQQEMARKAMEDAKRKAEGLAQQANRRVGRILNIEDTSTGCCGEIKDQKSPTTSLTYHINVTYQLKG